MRARVPVLSVVAVCILGCGKYEPSKPGDSQSTAPLQAAGPASAKAASPSFAKEAPGQLAFVDQKKQVGPGLEWNKEIGSKRGGTISVRVTSQGPFSVLLVTDRGRNALLSGDPKAFKKEDSLLMVDSKEPVVERKVTVPAGSCWLILENQANKAVEMHLECFEARQ